MSKVGRCIDLAALGLVILIGFGVYKFVSGCRSKSGDDPVRFDNPAPVDNPTPVGNSAPKITVSQLEEIMNCFYRPDSDKNSEEFLNRLVADHNKYVEEVNAALESERCELEDAAEVISSIAREIDKIDKRIDNAKTGASRNGELKSLSDLESLRQAKVDEYNSLIDAYRKHEDKYDKMVSEFKTRASEKKNQLANAEQDLKKNIELYQKWREENQDLAFFVTLNRVYADLHKVNRVKQGNLDNNPDIARLRAMRKDLAAFVSKKSPNTKDDGLILVEAVFCGSETCYMLLDTGASTVTISTAMVEVLGLSDRLGKEVEVGLAGGVRIKGREIVIPGITVLGCEAKNVDAVVIGEPMIGIDGLLGHSFLDRFAYRIDKTRSPELILNRKSADAKEQEQM